MKKLHPEEGGGLELRSDNCGHLAQHTVEPWKEINRFHIKRQRKAKV